MVAALTFFVVFLSSACGDDDDGATPGDGPGPEVVRPEPAGDPRGARIGFSALPVERTTESYIQAFATAAQYGDLVLVQRNVPWADFMPGGRISQDTTDTTRLETSLLDQYEHLRVFYAIDPTDGDVQRTRIANLPTSVDPAVGFNDAKLREAFIAYTAYVVTNYRPAYLALGVEVNMLYERKPDQFAAFVSLYKEAYAVAKGNDPNVKVFPTFQLEDLEGTFEDIHPAHWEVLDAFAGSMDVLAVSTYPYLGDANSASSIREDYYTQLRAHFDGEIAIAETAYPSAPVEGESVVGTEEDQQAYLARVLGDAEANGFAFVVWLAALDPSFAGGGAASVFRDVGLRRSDGANKLAWTTWEEWARRPLK